jgi:hypothetical protein
VSRRVGNIITLGLLPAGIIGGILLRGLALQQRWLLVKVLEASDVRDFVAKVASPPPGRAMHPRRCLGQARRWCLDRWCLGGRLHRHGGGPTTTTSSQASMHLLLYIIGWNNDFRGPRERRTNTKGLLTDWVSCPCPQRPPPEASPSKSMARAWQEHGKSMARTWQEHVKTMARAWQEPGNSIANTYMAITCQPYALAMLWSCSGRMPLTCSCHALARAC